MTTVKEFNDYGEILEKTIGLRTSPLAVKMLESEADIPEGAYRPKRDDGIHYSQCQAFAMSRRDKKAVAMLKEDNWCPAPITAFGLDERPERPDMVPGQAMGYYCFEPGKYIGILTAPLKTATYIPDLVLMYPTTNQLRGLLMTIPPEDAENLNSHFFAPSCTYAVVNPIMTGQYWIVLPDPGETARAVADDGEMMFSVPADKMDGLIAGMKRMGERIGRFGIESRLMLHDFPQPPHYINAFKMWGMDHDETNRFKIG
jgi:uncharacterized protein (DUF169 family)